MLPRYKAIDNETGVMLRVLSIDLEFDYIIGLPFEEEAKDTFGELIIEKRYYFEDIELLQSTGLFDKNGKEIFEGHIVKDTDGYVGYIAFLKQEMGYVVVYKTYDKRLGHRYRLDDGHLEILGNIYEHPHLLGED